MQLRLRSTKLEIVQLLLIFSTASFGVFAWGDDSRGPSYRSGSYGGSRYDQKNMGSDDGGREMDRSYDSRGRGRASGPDDPHGGYPEPESRFADSGRTREAHRGSSYYPRLYNDNNKREVYFTTNKKTIGYLRNVGTGRFLGFNQGKNAIEAFPDINQAIRVAIVTSFSDSVGTYQEIIEYRGDDSSFGTNQWQDPHYGARRFDVWGGLSQDVVSLYYNSTLANRLAITLPYYKGEGPIQFKIRISRYCMSISPRDYLLHKGVCVDEDPSDNSYPSLNNLQLFELVSEDEYKECKRALGML